MSTDERRPDDRESMVVEFARQADQWFVLGLIAFCLFPPTGLIGALTARQAKDRASSDIDRAHTTLLTAKLFTIATLPIFFVLVVLFVMEVVRHATNWFD